MSHQSDALQKSSQKSRISSRSTCNAGHSYTSENSGDQRTAISGISSKGFKIGDRVHAGGLRRGTICFIGQTRFAQGEWAGINLDNPEGKNDGSVQGIRYFQCPPLHGLFSRLNSLTLEAKPDFKSRDSDMVTPEQQNSSITSVEAENVDKTSNQLLESAPISIQSDFKDFKEPRLEPDSTLTVGMRVIVGGTRPGTLRYIGNTDFSKGNALFAGVELDEPNGKNDGSVDGKRYFSCKPRFGLFAPVHRVHPLNSKSVSRKESSVCSGSLAFVQSIRHSSSESINSTNSASASRTRLGVTSLCGGVTNAASRLGSSNSPTETLKKILLEKQEHIEQLLRERENERSEVARAQEHVEDAEEARLEASRQLIEAQNRIASLESALSTCESEKEDLREKLEDLQFTMAEDLVGDGQTNFKEQVSTLLEQVSKLEVQLIQRETDCEDQLLSIKKLETQNEELMAQLQLSCQADKKSSDYEALDDSNPGLDVHINKEKGFTEDLEKERYLNETDKDRASSQKSDLPVHDTGFDKKESSQQNPQNQEMHLKVLEDELHKRKCMLDSLENEIKAQADAVKRKEEKLNSEAAIIERAKDKLFKTESQLERSSQIVSKLKKSKSLEENADETRIEEVKVALEQYCLNREFQLHAYDTDCQGSVYPEKKLETREIHENNLVFSPGKQLQDKTFINYRHQCTSTTSEMNDDEQTDPFQKPVEKDLGRIESSDALSSQLKQQIDFLNSVIIDLKLKNEELVSKLYLLNDSESSLRSFTTVVADNARPYCDICEEFDLHETDDCPMQAEGEHCTKGGYNGDEAFRTRALAGERSGSQRPYCDNCERFGHPTEECNEDEETY